MRKGGGAKGERVGKEGERGKPLSPSLSSSLSPPSPLPRRPARPRGARYVEGVCRMRVGEGKKGEARRGEGLPSLSLSLSPPHSPPPPARPRAPLAGVSLVEGERKA